MYSLLLVPVIYFWMCKNALSFLVHKVLQIHMSMVSVHWFPPLHHHSAASFPGGHLGIMRYEHSSSGAIWPLAERLPQIRHAQAGEAVKHRREKLWSKPGFYKRFVDVIVVFFQINPQAMSCCLMPLFADEYFMNSNFTGQRAPGLNKITVKWWGKLHPKCRGTN